VYSKVLAIELFFVVFYTLIVLIHVMGLLLVLLEMSTYCYMFFHGLNYGVVSTGSFH
jgi:hypothetical protein